MNAQEPGRFSLRAPRGRSSSSLRQTRDRKRRPSLENLEARTLLAVSITEYPTGTVHREPFEITAGPDRNLWFADQDANRIGRMTTSGTFVGEFPVISPDTSINALATGPDGNVWVAQGYRSGAGPLISQVSRVTPTGGVTNYPTSSIVETITAGPDGKMWFTESSGVVGSIDPATGTQAGLPFFKKRSKASSMLPQKPSWTSARPTCGRPGDRPPGGVPRQGHRRRPEQAPGSLRARRLALVHRVRLPQDRAV